MTLYIYAANAELKSLVAAQVARHRLSDSGFDIPVLDQTTLGTSHSFDLGIHVAAVRGGQPRPCLLLPRSSIYKTPYRLCNSIGLIDQGYRGEVKAKVDIGASVPDARIVNYGERLFQIVQHDFLPWDRVVLVDSLFDLPAAGDDRGAGGFGSTN